MVEGVGAAENEDTLWPSERVEAQISLIDAILAEGRLSIHGRRSLRFGDAS
jgi:hypothetical protein